ncbi:uncharacterized protein LOC129596515 [Paramacrobiotus metropolitanus]|uniref:uncharacterized protein LOC129596515 n=1 Tax=Paramacrobiotus metropolitanus TaxID=2943436 RepID=UPI002445BD28|nr:uncharacterized protein LOC129596515 [Paramacrobiotus metropolitanus]
MNTAKMIWTVFVLFVFSSMHLFVGGAFYNYHDLGSKCDGEVKIECPPLLHGRAGTFQLTNISRLTGNCVVNVIMVPGCASEVQDQLFSIYFSIRKLNIPSTDRLRMHQYDEWNSTLLLKDLTLSWWYNINPTSVAQARTSWNTHPRVQIEYTRGITNATSAHQMLIDYVIVEFKRSSGVEGYLRSPCPTLNGYIHNDFVCDADGVVDRVNCPGFYYDSIGNNPAMSRYCDTRYPTTTGRSTTYRYEPWTPSYDDGMDAGTIAGIIIAVFFFVVLLICTVSSAKSRQRRSAQPTVTLSRPTAGWSGSRTTSEEPPHPFMGAPPSYEEVTRGNNVAIAMPQPEVPKY